MWMHSCARADANPAKTQELCHLLWVPAFQLREEKRKMLPCGCCLLSIREKPGSLQASREVITTINRLHSQPCSRDCCKVVGGTGISALLPPGVSLQLAGNCPRAGTAPVKSEEDVNLLTIFAVCVSSQMKLINKGRNVTLSKVLTSKSKYLHRCAGSCQLLWDCNVFGSIHAPHSLSTVSSLLSPSSTVGSFKPWWRAGTAAQREKGSTEP